ncbi:MAG: B-box zinc finger protein [Acidobacteriota bacterium]|jgi:hypothetical protein|nr:B-box zinc finger protein [Acidobacteriota bacterium]
MNCANHGDIAAVAYCRTCGKALCANCTREVKGVIYCENCLAERMQGAPVAAAYSGTPLPPTIPHDVRSSPNPALAGILAGIFPFGVGAVYCGLYAKGLAHLLIFTGLVWGLSSGQFGSLEPVLGIGMGFFIVYQIIDAIRSAKAIQLGQPVPDPFGLGHAFSSGEHVDPAIGAETSSISKVPRAAIVLIGLGILFLLHTAGILAVNADRIWPLFVIGLGVWLYAKRQGMVGSRYDRQGRVCRTGGLVGPAVLITVGILSLIEGLNGPGWGRTWPVLLLVIGLTRLLESKNPPPAAVGGTGQSPAGPGVVTTDIAPVPTDPDREVHNG